MISRIFGNVTPVATMTGSTPAITATRSAALDCYFLERLERLAMLSTLIAPHDPRRRLVDFALYSTYGDCAERGFRARARAILGLPE